MVKPVMPTVKDALAHVLNYSDHIATVHLENGKYHVHQEYMEAANKHSDNNTTNPGNNKKVETSAEHLLVFPIATTTQCPTETSHSPLTIPLQKFRDTRDIFHPPVPPLSHTI